MSSSYVLKEKLNIILLGKSGVGKINFVTRFLVDVLNNSEISLDMAIGATHIKRKVEVNRVSFNVEIWASRYDSMASMYCSGRIAGRNLLHYKSSILHEGKRLDTIAYNPFL